MARHQIEDFWEDGYLHIHYEENGTDYWEDIPMSEHEYLYDEPDPNDTGEYYDEWMPEFTGAE